MVLDLIGFENLVLVMDLVKTVIIFGADLSSSSPHENSKKTYILALGKDLIQGINGRKIYAEKLYKINFTEKNKKFRLSLKDFSVDNMKKKKTGLNGYLYDFSVDYDATAVDDILDIHKYLMEKNGIV